MFKNILHYKSHFYFYLMQHQKYVIENNFEEKRIIYTQKTIIQKAERNNYYI